MPDLIYLANSRLPTEKAHGLQIVQMCEAFVQVGYTVTLVTARRRNTAALRSGPDLWTYYGVKRCFAFRRVPCLDLLEIAPSRLQPAAFLLQTLTTLFTLWFWLLSRRAEVYYTRDLFIGALMVLTRPRSKLVYEMHQVHSSWLGRRIQSLIARRAAAVIPITAHLGEKIRALGAKRVLVAHDGIRQARFENMPPQAEARAEIGWPSDAFIVGWVGRLHLMGADKGVGTLVEALQQVEGVTLALVGGPDEMADALHRQWRARGLDESRFLFAGHVPPDRVPVYLSAFDVCAMPHPWTDHFAYATSPIKLFEYMASGRAIIASDLPGFVEVIRHEESALLVPPGNAAALAAAITRLRDDWALRQKLADRARTLVFSQYTWSARAKCIRAFIEEGG